MKKRQSISRRRFIEDVCRRAGQASLGLGMAQMLAGCRQTGSATTPGTGNAASASTPADLARKFIGVVRRAVSRMLPQFRLASTLCSRSAGCDQHYFVEQVASGAALFDANGDGFLDIYFPQPKPLGACKSKYPQPLHHRLYINDGQGHFTLETGRFWRHRNGLRHFRRGRRLQQRRASRSVYLLLRTQYAVSQPGRRNL